jgi:hypothetical protein
MYTDCLIKSCGQVKYWKSNLYLEEEKFWWFSLKFLILGVLKLQRNVSYSIFPSLSKWKENILIIVESDSMNLPSPHLLSIPFRIHRLFGDADNSKHWWHLSREQPNNRNHSKLEETHKVQLGMNMHGVGKSVSTTNLYTGLIMLLKFS